MVVVTRWTGGKNLDVRRNLWAARDLLRADPTGWWSDVRVARRAVELGAMQKIRELAPLLGLVRRLEARVVVEIGSAKGGTFYAWAQVTRPDALLVSIDLPGGAFGGRLRGVDVGPLARDGQAVEAIRGDSHDPETFERLLSVLGGRPVDVLFIDGDHSYAGVRDDFERYAPLVRPGGLVALHDIVPHPPGSACEVDRFWLELSAGRRSRELVDRGGDRYGGVGVVYVDLDQRPIASR